jgi:hypothetical protein
MLRWVRGDLVSAISNHPSLEAPLLIEASMAVQITLEAPAKTGGTFDHIWATAARRVTPEQR